ncbi:beta/alpha barrel domain-containing protein [Celerinatantimonas diazotrophica]|uniref:Ribulose-5-phosphate 3-epimerase n=1 Tax=Celerinatantimonas diazotrophica TaxID=412034 RepID=A0A4R1J959_9GAMM|nr:ribulose phosphate epimerase [Celerinatantimonas diazotrophica]TCK46924.1 ribulose-5-phosphate 3-epimerase [Celerinatantimonas diazotrophica]CAG9295692.1 Putative epimerase LsrE [Celerinatantimonas diazotrophica]
MSHECKKQLLQHLKHQSISAAILASGWLELPQTLTKLQQHQVDLLHFDIADGYHWPLFTTSETALKQFDSHVFKDVHLMVRDNFEMAQKSYQSGANAITLQIENAQSLDATLTFLKDKTAEFQGKSYPLLIGLAIMPTSDIEVFTRYIDDVDLFTLVTFDLHTGEKLSAIELAKRVQQLVNILGERRKDKMIALDGGINDESLAQLSQLGMDIDWLVAGSGLFRDHRLTERLKTWPKHLQAMQTHI